MAEPRILFVDHSPELGGAELYLADLAPFFDDCLVFAFARGPFVDELQKRNVRYVVSDTADRVMNIKAGSSFARSVVSIPNITKIVREVARTARDFDLVFANSQKAGVVGGLAAKIARVPMVWNLHDVMTAQHFSATNRTVAKFVGNKLAKQTIFNSKATREAFREIGGRVADGSIVYNGIDPEIFNSVVPDDIEQLRSSLKLSGRKVVGLFGRISEWKGQLVLLEAMTSLQHVHCLIVGAPLFAEDHQYDRRIREFVRDHDLVSRVHFLGFRDDVPELMSMVDVVAHTSTSPEPFGRVIVEAMMAGTPVVAARAGGAVEIVEPGRTGWLTTPGDPVELAKTLGTILDLPAGERQSVAEQAHRAAHELFSRPVMINGVREIVNKVLE